MFVLRRRYQYYLLLVVILALYRALIDGTSGPGWFAPTVWVSALLATVAVTRHQMAGKIENGPIVTRQQRHFLAEILVYGIVAVGILLADTLWFGQALLTGLRFAALALVFGYLASIDSTLARIPDWFELKDPPFIGRFRMFPDTWRLAILPGSIVVALTGLLFLSGYGFAASLRVAAVEMQQELFRKLLVDLALTLIVVAGMSLLIIQSYSANLKRVIDRQVKVLKDAQTDDFTGEVPIISHDAFGVLASQINRVMDYLRERTKVYDVLKRIVSPSIMEKLVSTDSDALKRGQTSQLAILFCDIRGFTSASESSSAHEMLLFLNSYFSDLSELVSAHNGIINKFLGDGILAVYGIEDPSNAVTDAFNTARDIVGHSEGFSLPDGSVPEVGVGIHFGIVVAGTVGSEQRYEYTFLGDTVNTASRLEGLSKRLGHKIIVSDDAFLVLADELRKQLKPLGAQRVRGKSEAIHVYGAAPQSAT